MVVAEWQDIESRLQELRGLEKRKEALEAYAAIAFDWKPSELDSIIASAPKSDHSSENSHSPDYTAAARDWAETTKSFRVTINDFIEYLQRSYTHDEINRNSLNAPLRTLVKEGLLEVVRPGEGRRPTQYKIPKNRDPYEFDHNVD